MTIKDLHQKFLKSTGVCTDTRKLEKGKLYVALKGDNFNGNEFAQKALEDGALLAIIDEPQKFTKNTVLVDNALTTLQKLATYHRNYLNIPIISLTGSNGKTTTKELINRVLSKKFTTTATIGNLNNHIGVPLTLLSMTDKTQIGIVEMGANHQKEIEHLSSIAQPNYGYITNFGKAHLEGFGGVQGVIKGKSELYDYLRHTDGIAFVNDLDNLQIKQSEGLNTITFGSNESHYSVQFLHAKPTVSLAFKNLSIDSKLVGGYNFSNIAAAIAIGTYFKIPAEVIKDAITSYIPENNRSQIVHREAFTIILDAYNANPTSMAAALEHLATQTDGSRVAFLGDMFEVGNTKEEEHQNILKLAHKLKIDKVFAVGPTFGHTNPLSSKQEVFEDYNALAKAYSYTIPPEAVVLIKGSRGMKMERTLDLLGS